MPSKARAALDVALADVDAQIAHAKSFAGGKRGAPAANGGATRPGRPFTRAAAVMLAGSLEGYVEALAVETGGHLNLTPEQVKDLKDQATRTHGANIHHIHGLLATVGMPFALDPIGWRGLPKNEPRATVKSLASARNKIAHGAAPKQAELREVERARKLIERVCDELDTRAAQHVFAMTTSQPW